MATEAPRVYVDTNVFTNVFTGGATDPPDWLSESKWLLAAAQAGNLTIVISPLVEAEVLGAGGIRGSNIEPSERQRCVAAVQAYFRDNDLTYVELDARLGRQAADLAVAHQLKGPDAVHLASALRARCSILYSWDEDFLKLGQIHGMTVQRPRVVGQTELDYMHRNDSGGHA